MTSEPSTVEPAERSKTGNVIPESLLAIAKDGRYIYDCKAQLLRVLQPFVTNRTLEQWEPAAGLISHLLYTVLVVLRKKRTAGMEACGIEFERDLSRWRLFLSAATVALWTCGVQHASASLAATASNSSGPSQVESLSGEHRRRIFEQQRLQMLQRAEAPESNPMIVATRGKPKEVVSPSGTLERVKSVSLPILRLLSTVVATPNGGPHAIDGDEAIQDNSGTTWETVGYWIVRLHLAAYCLQGTFPTWTHRLLYRIPLRQESTRASSALVHVPNSTRVVGGLILIQAGWTLVASLSQGVVHWLADMQTTLGSTKTSNVTASRIVYEGLPAVPVKTTTTCTICRQTRRFPACPISCGHVFCWHCLQQWVASHSQACPLCRKPCTTSEIVLLHNYDDSTATFS
jgi:Ring finger domain